MTLKGNLGKKDDIGGATGMVAAASLLMAESVGAGEVWCEGGDDGDEAERAMADAARAGRIGDIGGAGSAGESALGEAGKVSDSTGGVLSIIVSEHIEQANVEYGGRDDGLVSGSVADISGLERGERRSSSSSSGSCSSSASFPSSPNSLGRRGFHFRQRGRRRFCCDQQRGVLAGWGSGNW
jgi:hypothetical protein